AGAGGMVGGQVADLEGEGRRADLALVESIHRRKTAALIAAAVEAGALAGGAEDAALQALRDYGGALGRAFQVPDDLLDATRAAASTMATARTERVDKLLVDRGLVESRERAQRLVMAGLVFAGTARVEKPGVRVRCDVVLEVRGEDHPYVSRGGVKLASVLDALALDVRDAVVLDVGASTGGFTDRALQRGARRVYAVDVGYGQLAWKLREDLRVVSVERANS